MSAPIRTRATHFPIQCDERTGIASNQRTGIAANTPFLVAILTLSYRGGGGQNTPPPVFLHHCKTALGIKLKLFDFKDTPLRHFMQVKLVRYILSCCHGNKITKGTLQNVASKKSEKSAICKDIELKFAIETMFGPLSSKTNINLQFDVIVPSL